MLEFLIKQLGSLSQLDLGRPSALIIYFGIFALLAFQYSREATEVHREYGRMHRDIRKDSKLQSTYTSDWKERLQSAVHLFNLGPWFILHCLMLLILFVGLMLLLHLPSNKLEDNQPKSLNAPWTISIVNNTNATSVTTIITLENTSPLSAKVGETDVEKARVEAQRLLGVFFIVVCISASLLMKHQTYSAFQKMYEFSCHRD